MESKILDSLKNILFLTYLKIFIEESIKKPFLNKNTGASGVAQY
jgi:hypothetical protein